MAVFVYQGCAAEGNGTLLRGTIAADSPRQARDRLREQGMLIHEVTEQPNRTSLHPWQRYLVRRQSAKVSGFLQELATLLGAGIPLLETLDTITRQHAGTFQQSVMLIRDHVASGGSLADAMGQQPQLFDELCRNIVEVGESAGTLDTSLGSLVEFRRRSAGQRNRVLTALLYPCIVMCVAVGVSVFLMTYVVPRLLEALLESGKPLPLATVIIKTASDALLGWWWAILLALAALVTGVVTILRTD